MLLIFYKLSVLWMSAQNISWLHLRCGPNALILVTQGSWLCLGWAGHGRIAEKSWESFAPGWLGQGVGRVSQTQGGEQKYEKTHKKQKQV